VAAHFGDFLGDEQFAETEGGEDHRCGLCHARDNGGTGCQRNEQGQAGVPVPCRNPLRRHQSVAVVHAAR
jgi:hypothetical protein